MAYYTKYQAEFTDDKAVNWKVEIQKTNSTAFTIIPLQCATPPLTIEWYGDDDIFEQRIMGSKITLNIWNPTDFVLSELFTSDNLQYPVIVSHGSTVFWTGFILANNYQEPYNQVPVFTSIIATDGLGLLKDFMFSDFIYTTRQKISQVIFDILSLVGIASFTEYINVYESDMDSDVDDSPLDQTVIDPDLFAESTCYEVLDEILKLFNAGIKTEQNQTIIYRFVELTGETMYGRTFTSGTSKSSVTKSPAQYIKRSTQASNFSDVEGGMLMIIPQVKKLTINQDYGYKESWINNYKLSADTWDGSDSFKDWISASGTNAVPISSKLAEGDNGAYLDSYDASGPVGYYIRQEFAPHAVVDAGGNCAIEFDYLVHNITAVDVANLTIGVRIKQGAYYLLGTYTEGVGDTGFASWVTPAEAFLTYTMTAVVGVSGWLHFKKDIIGTPSTGVIEIILFASNKADVYVAFKDVKFYTYSEEIAMKYEQFGLRPVGSTKFLTRDKDFLKFIPRYLPVNYGVPKKVVSRTYVITGAPTGREFGYNFLLGDVVDANVTNVCEQFAGALAFPVTVSSQARVDTITLTGGGVGDIAMIFVNGVTQFAEYDSDLSTTAAKFVTDHAADYIGITVTSSGQDIIFTADAAGVNFSPTISSINPDVGTLGGTVEYTTPASIISSLSPTVSWNTRMTGGEDTEITKLIGDELRDQYIRPRQLIDLPIRETAVNSYLSLSGHLQDPLNQINSYNRIFAISRATFNVRLRDWKLSLSELIYDTSVFPYNGYGALYNYYVVEYDTAGASIAPAGWHVPTLAEYLTLFTAAGGLTVAGATLRETGTSHWESDEDGATNAYGFNGKGAGSRDPNNGLFGGLKERLSLWTTSLEEGEPYAVLMYIGSDNFDPIFGVFKHAFSIRLIKDDSTDPLTMTDYDLNVYPTVKIGDQVWMATNLKVEHFNDGTEIPIVTDDEAWTELTAEAMCYYNNIPD